LGGLFERGDSMDKNMLYRDLLDSAGGDRNFDKTVIPFSDTECDNYMKTLKELETEGRITMEECRIHESIWDKMIKMKGHINL
jgi:hypothetical protein